MESKLFVGVISVFVMVIILGSVLVPIINDAAGPGTPGWDEEVTTTYNDPSDATMILGKMTADFALDMLVEFSGSDITVTNGEDVVTGSFGPTFIYAADNSAIFIDSADNVVCVYSDENGTYQRLLDGDFTAEIGESSLTINDGESFTVPLPTTYLYYPSSTGQYGSFADADLNKSAEDPVIAAGSFAGVAAYNELSIIGPNLAMIPDATDELITGVSWGKPVGSVDFDPDSITIVPFDPSTIIPLDPIDLGDENQIMSVPTPSYTDGDWGYNVDTSGSHANEARIVSYSGSGGSITVPSTIGGYHVYQFGIGNNSETVFPSNIAITDVIISDGIEKLGTGCLQGLSNVTGTLYLPGSVESIGTNACRESGLSGVVLPEGLTTIGIYGFWKCTNLTGTIIIPSTVTSIGGSSFADDPKISSLVMVGSPSTVDNAAFKNTTNLKEVLNLGTLTITTTSYQMNADVVADSFDAVTYLAPTETTTIIHHPGSSGSTEYSPLLMAIPMIVIIAILGASVTFFLSRRSP